MTTPPRATTRRPSVQDMFTAGLVILCLLNVAVRPQHGTGWWLELGLCLLGAVAVWVRPLWLAVAVGFTAAQFQPHPVSIGVYLLALAASTQQDREHRRIGQASTLVALVGLAPLVGEAPPIAVICLALFLVIPMIVTSYYRAALRNSEEELRRVMEQRTRERFMLARELHDTISLAMTHVLLMTDDRSALDEDPRQRLKAIGNEAQLALTDLRSLLDLLRNEGTELTSSSGLDREVSHSVDVLRKAGYTLSLDAIENPSAHVPDQALARTLTLALREMTANVLRHSSAPSNVSLVIAATSGAMYLSMSNSCREDDERISDLLVSGHGLGGLRERLEQHGGTLTTHLEDERWSTIITVPVTPTPPTGVEP